MADLCAGLVDWHELNTIKLFMRVHAIVIRIFFDVDVTGRKVEGNFMSILLELIHMISFGDRDKSLITKIRDKQSYRSSKDMLETYLSITTLQSSVVVIHFSLT